jgi:replication-associated recombination protein RarA
VTTIDGAFVDTTVAQSLRRFDKGGDAFYDQISALHKAVRGSSPDAALYWFCRMLDGGADPRYLARRIVRMAWEDIGLADPRAARIALDAAETFERLGSPEGELALAEAVLYLAMAAKSNAGYLAYNAARSFIGSDASRPVPVHLRNAPTRLMKNLGYGKDYRYAHDEPKPTPPARPIFRRACRRSSGIDRSSAASRSGSARSWPSCASSIAGRKAEHETKARKERPARQKEDRSARAQGLSGRGHA